MSTTAILPGSVPAVSRRHRAGRFAVYAIVLAIGIALAFAPFLFPDVRAQEVAARICVFIVLVASYDLLIGYTGIVSFAHTMFFGLGAYGAAIALKTMGPGFDAILLGGSLGVLAAVVLAVLIGLLVRAGVENREMVEALGFRIDRLFIAVFMAGSALAAMGGAMWAGYQGLITPALGAEMLVLVFIVVIIGGLGSIEGSLLGAIMVGLMANYVAFLFPKLALASNMLLMMAILLWRPFGLKPAVKG